MSEPWSSKQKSKKRKEDHEEDLTGPTLLEISG
jgi:hypothetical protein